MAVRQQEFDRLFTELNPQRSSPADLLLQGAGGILGGALSLEDLLESILDRVLQDCGATRGFVLLDADSGNYHVIAARSAPIGPLYEPWQRISNTIVQRVLRTCRPVYSGDAIHDPSLSSSVSVRDLAIRSVLCMPMLWLGRPLGAIYVESDAGGLEDSEHRDIEELAEKAGIVLGILLTVRNYEKVTESLRGELTWLQRRTRPSEGQTEIIGSSDVLQRLRSQASQVAREEMSVLLVGETGTGKDLFARWIHEQSRRRSGPFVAVNSSAIQDSLAESELFGHVRGAYTGASSSRAGRVEQAENGTLFLDEIGDMSPSIQAKILRLLETNDYCRLGEDRPRRANIRVIAATNRNLASLMADGRFRPDLFYRLDQYRLRLPPLRERLEDLPDLVDHILRQCTDPPRPRIEPATFELMRRYLWPGNIRELGHVLRRCLVGLTPGARLTPELMQPHLNPSATVDSTDSPGRPVLPQKPLEPLREVIADFEKEYLRQALLRYPQDNRSELAEKLGLPLRSLHERLKAHGLSRVNRLRAPRS